MAIVNTPWDGSESRWDTAESYCSSCLIDENPSGKPKVKGLCKLPVKEPNGDLNANAVRNAAARINQVDASPAAKKAAMSRLMALKKQAKIGQ